MNDYELSEIRRRDSHFIKELPKPGPSDAMHPDIKDALHDRRELLAEVDRLNRWKAEATSVIMGLQDLGRALELPLGENITGPAALAEVDRLRADLAELRELYQGLLDDH